MSAEPSARLSVNVDATNEPANSPGREPQTAEVSPAVSDRSDGSAETQSARVFLERLDSQLTACSHAELISPLQSHSDGF